VIDAIGGQSLSDSTWLRELTDKTLRNELDSRHPERKELRPTDVSGLRRAFAVLEQMWEPTIERARGLPAAKVHERVDGEYSFVETLRHLLFAWDSWITRMVLRVPNGYHPWGVAPEALADAVVELDRVLEVRAESFARVGNYLSSASDADLQTIVSPPDPSGWPQTNHPVIYCFRVVLHDEWWHHQYALRDLVVLETR
jgi:hypothetical protein